MSKKLSVLFALLVVAYSSAALAQMGRRPVWMPGTVIAVDGSYTVTRNIVAVGPVPVITIVAPNVDLDLNGFTLAGTPGVPVISVPGPVSEVRIHDGRLSGGSMSIDAGTGRKLVIEKVQSQDAGGPGAGAIHASDIENLVVRECTVVGATTAFSVALDGAVAGKTGEIARNVLESSGSGGIEVLNGQAFAVLHNRIDGPGTGIELYCSGCLISENTVRATAADGIRVRGWGDKFYDNVVENSGGSGINILPGTDDCLLLNNVLTMNTGHGVWVQGIRNQIERNTLNGNTGCGLYFTAPSNTFGRNMARGNTGFACGPCPAGLFFPNSCDAAGGNSSFGDNLIPGPPIF